MPRSTRSRPSEELVALPSDSEGAEEELFEEGEEDQDDASDNGGVSMKDNSEESGDSSDSGTSDSSSDDRDDDSEDNGAAEPASKRSAVGGDTSPGSNPDVVLASASLFETSKFRRSYALHDACETGNVKFIEEAFARDENGDYLPHVRDIKADARDLDACTPLHVAILNGQLECMRVLLENGAEVMFRCEGSSVLHMAAAMSSFADRKEVSTKAVELLLQHEADPNALDDLGRTVLHIAAQFNNQAVAELLMNSELFAGKDVQDKDKNTAVHIAVQFHSFEVLRYLVVTGGARTDLPNAHGWLPIHTAAYFSSVHGGLSHSATVAFLVATGLSLDDPKDALGRVPREWALRNSKSRKNRKHTQPERTESNHSQASVARDHNHSRNEEHLAAADRHERRELDGPSCTVLWSEECFAHHTAEAIARRLSAPPPENVRRLRVLLDSKYGVLRADEFVSQLSNAAAGSASSSSRTAPRVELTAMDRAAALVDVLRCHEYSYVHRLKDAVRSVEEATAAARREAGIDAVPGALREKSLSFALTDSAQIVPAIIQNLDGDTAFSAGSYRASLIAAGLACEAVDRVVSGKNRTAFCAVRPPGHHAGPTGVVHANEEHEGSSHGFCLLNNVAIAAGYARCVHRHAGIRRIAIVDFDVHHGNGTEAIVRNLIPNVSVSKLSDEFISSMVIKRNSYKPWLDETDVDEVFFASVHGRKEEGPWFYPGSGATTSGVLDAMQARAIDANQLPEHLLPYTSSEAAGRLVAATVPEHGKPQVLDVGIGLGKPVRVWRQAWRHAILPKLLQHKPDLILISAGFDAHKRDDINIGYIGLDERDYYWLTKQLVKVANTVCDGRIVSALEGGYRIHGKHVSPFARSVAAHVRALSEGCEECWDPLSAAHERQVEDAEEEAIRQQMLAVEAQRRAQLEAQRPGYLNGTDSTTIITVTQASVSVTASSSAAQAAALPQISADGEAPRERPRRARAPVDYVALNAELERQQQEKRKLREAAAAASAKN